VPSLRFSLPVIEYRRRLLNEGQTIRHATELLQRVFRGFRGRAKYRRLRWKRFEYVRQQQTRLQHQERVAQLRAWRGERLNVVQRLFRGYRWRKRLCLMKWSALLCQCAYRMHRARRMVALERKRRAEGAPVYPMLGEGRGVQVGAFQFTLKIYRSGTNYRLEGIDLLRGVTYEGTCYTAEVLRLIAEHNAPITGSSVHANSRRIMPWQHDRVVELLVANLGMMQTIQPLTTQLGAAPSVPASVRQPKYILVTNKHASISVPPVVPAASQQQLFGVSSAPQSILDVAAEHTRQQRLRRQAEFRMHNLKNRRLQEQKSFKSSFSKTSSL
jgi:hypothetical protein